MATEFEVRINASFQLRELVRPIREVVCAILGRADLVVGVIIVPSASRFRTDPDRTIPLAPREMSKLLRRGSTLSCGVAVTEMDAAVDLNILDIGEEDDPELGTWFVIDAGATRDANGTLLALAVAAAVAKVTGAQIRDDWGRLLGSRDVEPGDVLNPCVGHPWIKAVRGARSRALTATGFGVRRIVRRASPRRVGRRPLPISVVTVADGTAARRSSQTR